MSSGLATGVRRGMKLPLGMGCQQPHRRRVSAGRGTADPSSACPQVFGARIWSYCGNEFWASNCSQTVGEDTPGASNWSEQESLLQPLKWYHGSQPSQSLTCLQVPAKGENWDDRSRVRASQHRQLEWESQVIRSMCPSQLLGWARRVLFPPKLVCMAGVDGCNSLENFKLF